MLLCFSRNLLSKLTERLVSYNCEQRAHAGRGQVQEAAVLIFHFYLFGEAYFAEERG
jgi:hypothetical protein